MKNIKKKKLHSCTKTVISHNGTAPTDRPINIVALDPFGTILYHNSDDDFYPFFDADDDFDPFFDDDDELPF